MQLGIQQEIVTALRGLWHTWTPTNTIFTYLFLLISPPQKAVIWLILFTVVSQKIRRNWWILIGRT
jgi:hypothetical protein